jgi:hypothetical protein
MLLQVALYALTICALMAATRGKAVLCDGAWLSGADEHLPPFARPAHASGLVSLNLPSPVVCHHQAIQ